MKLNHTQVVIAGASGGIGSALCRALDARSVRLILIARRVEPLQALADTLQQDPLIISADLSCAEGRELAASRLRELAPIDIAINAAGSALFQAFEAQDEQRIEQTLRVNLLLPMLWTRTLLPLMNPAGARIVNLGSALGGIGYPGYSSYCSAKFGLHGFSQALDRELADTPTRIQYIAPRATRTTGNSDAANRMNAALGNAVDEPDAVAERILDAIEKGKSQRFIGWPERLLVPLNALLPSLVSRVIGSQLNKIKPFLQENMQ